MNTGDEVEVESLKQQIRALRETLERAHADRDENEQRARAEGQDELAQRRATITALRDLVEIQRAEMEAQTSAVQREAAAEAEQLRAAVIAARDVADEREHHHHQEMTDATANYEILRREWEATIKQLRTRLTDNDKAEAL
jgi:hypothetical protein